MRTLSICLALLLTATQPRQASRFELEFLAHSVTMESPGHAWVCLYRGPDTGPLQRECVGFFPADALAETFALLSAADRPAVVKSSTTDNGRIASVAFRGSITPSAYSAIQAVIASWKTRGYNIKWQNCADFVEAIALAAGLATPSHPGVKYPYSFITLIGEANTQKLRRVSPEK